jgi:pyrroloquinoline quinone biosynthesis protein D
MAAAWGVPHRGAVRLAPLQESSQPRFAAGCRWGAQGENQVILFPEGMIRVQGTGLDILELCDGQRTVQEIVGVLSRRYDADPAKIRADVHQFLEALRHKRIVDY